MSGYEDHPVTEVWQWAARAYCQWKGGDLPTEAQWEKAARGEGPQAYPWGDDPPTCELANFGTLEESCYGGTLPTGSLPDGSSPYGLLDKAGNVSEWVLDWFSTAITPRVRMSTPLDPLSQRDQRSTGQYSDTIVAFEIIQPALKHVDLFRQAEPHVSQQRTWLSLPCTRLKLRQTSEKKIVISGPRFSLNVWRKSPLALVAITPQRSSALYLFNLSQCWLTLRISSLLPRTFVTRPYR